MLALLRSLLLGVMAILRRVLCFLNIRRFRRDSGESLLPVHHKSSSLDGHLMPSGDQQQSSFMQETEEQYVGWDDWGSATPDCNGSKGGPGAVSLMSPNSGAAQQMRPYHQQGGGQRVMPPAQLNPEQEFFKEIEPKVAKTKKHYIGHDSPRQSSSKFAVQENLPFNDPTAELGAWNENEGWDIDEHAVRVPSIGAVRLS